MRRMMIALVGLAALLPVAAMAQGHGGGLRPVAPPPLRSGFYFSADLGGAYEAFDLDEGGSYSEDELGGHIALRMGGTPTPNLRVGAELAGWGKQLNQVDEYLGSFMAVAQFYPSATSGFYLKGGGGVTYFHQRVYDPFSGFYSEVDDNGFGLVAGLGWEFPVSRAVQLGPVVDVAWHDYGQFRERLISFGLSISTF